MAGCNEYLNEFKVSGKIIVINNNSVRIETRRNVAEIYPLFKYKSGMLDGFKTTDKVKICGHLEADHRKRRGEPIFCIDSIEPIKTLCEEVFDEQGLFICGYENTVHVKGKCIDKIFTGSNWFKLGVQFSPQESDMVYLSVRVPDNGVAFNIDIGDNICAVCSVFTKNKKVGNAPCHFENLIIDDIGVIKAEKIS